ncbi:hypothetical protein LOTGIDRAFT_227992 [Lottia gigantea]|uniref:Thioredoxin domain-containing protein n=1 Tax=Lottia gigantea TaxID=225164 RepID=V4CS94_LOTGI|nr:hypothetical protein LOTGIDRAFT_227992 [Lottia gigantea]ESP05370.1 hypothetical protein LOTGIDRAFT_227992 [Lottia gigantea]
MWLKLCVLTAVCQISVINTQSSERSERFEKHESFKDIFPLTQKNFTQKVLKSEDAWVVLFHSGTIKRGWKTMAVGVRGVISFGMVDINEQPELIGKLEYNIKDGKEARVYPYGSRSSKEQYMIETSNPNEAKTTALKSIPNYILDVKNMGIEDFIVDCLMSTPSRFPVIIFTEIKEIDPIYKVMAMKLETFFNFGHMINPSTSDLKQLGLEDVYIDIPTVMVLTTESDNIEDPQYNAIQYMKSAHGDLSYPNLLKFLVQINKRFRPKLPGVNFSDKKEYVEMSEVLDIESEKFEIQDVHHIVHTNVISDRDFVIENGVGGKHDEL